MKIVVGIDPGQSNLGLAKIMVKSDGSACLLSTLVTAWSWDYLRFFEEFISDADLIAIEQQPLSMKYRKIPAHQIARNAHSQGMLEGMCHTMGKTVVLLEPRAVFGQCKSKHQRIPYCEDVFGFDMRGRTHHEADAALIALHSVFPNHIKK